MIKSGVSFQSIGAYPREILEFHIRGYKYMRSVEQFKEDDDLIDFFVFHFLKTLGKTKILRKLKLQADPPTIDVQIKGRHVKAILKSHSQDLQSLDISDLSCIESSPQRRILLPVKNLKKLQIKGRKAEIKDLRAFKTLKNLSIDMRDTDGKINDLESILRKLINLKVLELSSYEDGFSEILELLERTTTIEKKQLDLRIKALKGDEPYANLSEINNGLKQMITQLQLSSVTTMQPLENIFKNQLREFQNLKTLRLEFSSSDLSLTKYLKIIGNIPLLESLLLDLTRGSTRKFSAEVISNLRLPPLLQSLELTMSLSLEDYTSPIEHANEKFQWREKNDFEEDPLFDSFFKAFERTKLLRKVLFDFRMLDSFSSYYTSFFVSILNRLPQLQSFALCVQDRPNQNLLNKPPEYLDFALLLISCSKMTELQECEVAMPNLLFENIEISPNLSNLREFHISITDPQDNELTRENKPLQFSNISACIKSVLKHLVSSAPNLKSLILNIGEVMDDLTFCDRFKLISEFKNLEYLYLQFLILECSYEAIQNVGKSLQSMKKLKTLVLQFNGSDPNTFALKTYINYQKSIKEVLLVSNTGTWLGDVACVKNF